MHGLVSLLPTQYYEEVESVWQELESGHGLSGIRVTPYPHFSWQIAEDYQFIELEHILDRICQSSKPITVRTGGLGVFSGEAPVIYIPVVKNQALLHFHATIWEEAYHVSSAPSDYYNPENWMPHISLAYNDVDEDNISGVLKELAFRRFYWEMTIDNLALIYEPSGEVGKLKYHKRFQT